MRHGSDDAQPMPEHDAHGDDVKGALAVAARKVRFHDVTLAEIREYDPSDHWTYESRKPVPVVPGSMLELFPTPKSRNYRAGGFTAKEPNRSTKS